MGDYHKLVSLAILAYAILIAMAVFQHNYINNQHDTIFKLKQRIIDLESPDKVDSIMTSIRHRGNKRDAWLCPENSTDFPQ